MLVVCGNRERVWEKEQQQQTRKKKKKKKEKLWIEERLEREEMKRNTSTSVSLAVRRDGC